MTCLLGRLQLERSSSALPAWEIIRHPQLLSAACQAEPATVLALASRLYEQQLFGEVRKLLMLGGRAGGLLPLSRIRGCTQRKGLPEHCRGRQPGSSTAAVSHSVLL